MLPSGLSALLLPPLLERLQDRFASFLFLLTHDTTGVAERWSFAPVLLAAWLGAALLGSPLVHGFARFLGSGAELRKSAGTAFGVAAIQCGFFALTWLVIAWGNRRLDWSIFATAALTAALVAKWGHELPYLRCLILVLLQSAVSLLLLFLLAFAFAELGWTEF